MREKNSVEQKGTARTSRRRVSPHAVACRVEAAQRPKNGGEQGVQSGGGMPRVFVYGRLGLQALQRVRLRLHAIAGERVRKFIMSPIIG